MWRRLGYPRRALRLHATAGAIVADHRGVLPSTHHELVALPGVGDYTAAAVLAFAHKQRIAVLDTNVRRVLARVRTGRALPATAAPTRAERDSLTDSLPEAPRAARVSEALMEFGALVCTAQSPGCGECPVAKQCEWRIVGQPEMVSPGRPQPSFTGSDRQVRGVILALLREAAGPVDLSDIDRLWPDAEQRVRAQESLVADGLLVIADGRVSLP
jgi:A/G-specific adenine glycosylase